MNSHEPEVSSLNNSHEPEVSSLNNSHEPEVSSLNNSHEQEVRFAQTTYNHLIMNEFSLWSRVSNGLQMIPLRRTQ